MPSFAATSQLGQTDSTYLKVISWGWVYLGTILDDYSRYIVAWKLCTTMRASDVAATLELALEAAGLDTMTVVYRPRLLSDNGSSYVSRDLAAWLHSQRMRHVRGAPHHPITQGKIERWHQTLKNRILVGPSPTMEPTPAAPLADMVADDVRKMRNYPEQPPVIPHSISGYQLSLNANRCLECHRREFTERTGAPMISVTHFIDWDYQVLSDVAPSRYFCLQCHVPQTDARPLVENEFTDMTALGRE